MADKTKEEAQKSQDAELTDKALESAAGGVLKGPVVRLPIEPIPGPTFPEPPIEIA